MEYLDNISKTILEKLSKSNYTLESIAISLPEDLMNELNISQKEAEELISAAQSKLGIAPLTAAEFLDIEKKRGKISTGSNELDAILGGGVWTQELTEFAGGFSSGKTQLCFQLCINVQLPFEDGGLDANAFFIDTERTFSTKRIEEIASYRQLNVHKVLERIIVARSLNTQHLFGIVNQLEQYIPKHNIKLVVIDSFASPFRSEYIGKDSLVERQQRIMQLAEKLVMIAVKHDVAVVVTNQIIANIDDFLFGRAEEPALGYAWAHRPQQRVFLRKSRGTARIARLFDSSRMPEREALFYVTEAGISDALFQSDVYLE
ncbi:MAG: DNA repair and recombination protein RadA [Candidatus Heimdallarchaeaceae archaeon]